MDPKSIVSANSTTGAGTGTGWFRRNGIIDRNLRFVKSPSRPVRRKREKKRGADLPERKKIAFFDFLCYTKAVVQL